MMRSMYSGVSGLRVHQTKMDVIANNISNINTIGFKRSSVTFKDSFNQTLTSASAAGDNKGGTNGQQVGMGANIGSIATVMTQGAAQRTDYATDLMIDGDGFFIVQDATGYSFTRAGIFEVDANGNLVNADGLNVCGWSAVDDPDNPGSQKIVKDVVEPINIFAGDNSYVPATESTSIKFTGNFNADSAPVQKNTMSFYDSQGNKYMIDIEFTRYDSNGGLLPANQWTASIPKGDNGHPLVTINGGEKMEWEGLELNGQPVTIEFNTDGTLSSVSSANNPLSFTLEGLDTSKITDAAGVAANIGGQFSGNITVDMSTVTQFTSSVTVSSQTLDGNTAGEMVSYAIDSAGIIRGTYSNGETKVLAQIPLANFSNPAGLEKYGSNLYKVTSNSGDFDGIGLDATSLGSTIQTGALEMSNVDLAYEFSEMITTQRGFQANSRIISTCDEIIQELVNLKR